MALGSIVQPYHHFREILEEDLVVLVDIVLPYHFRDMMEGKTVVLVDNVLEYRFRDMMEQKEQDLATDDIVLTHQHLCLVLNVHYLGHIPLHT